MTATRSAARSTVEQARLLGIDPEAAAARLAGRVIRTPTRRLPWLERLVGVPVYAKLEMQQHTGSFKFRGALNAALAGPQRPIIAASAGNHGLAVAEVARRLDRPANICIPVTASRLKRERILATGAGLIEYGNSLEEATRRARQLAAEQNLYYISPYNDPHVVAGAATIALELLDDIGDIATMIAPVGGGGLLSGLAVGAAAAGSQAVLLGCEPERYRSVSASLAAERIVRVVHQPTLADGLAVNLESSSITFPLIRDLVRSVESLDEEELAAATLALLVHESLLVEPAGAAAVVACLRLAQRGQLDGPVALPLCGGNLHHTTLTRIQRFPYGDPELIRLLDLRGRAVTELPVSRATTSGQPAAGPSEDPRSGSRSGPRSGSEEAQLDLDAQLGSWAGTLATVLAEVEEYTEYCANAGVLVDQDIIQTLRRDCAAAAQRLAEARAQLATAADADTVARAEIVLRHAATVAGSARAALDWCSPSYAQATVSQFFDVGAQDNPTVNYERYESTACQRVESQLLEVLGLSPQRQAVTATSSGMAAYSLIEAFLLRHRLRPGDTVLLAPYVYFEASEQLLSLPSVKCVTASAYSVDGLLAEVRQHRPRCLFIDPITNTADQRLIDIPALLRGLAAATSDPLTVVIDGTMASAALSGSVFDTAPHIEVLYYESCSKYLQLGMDVAMAGVVATPVELRHAFDRIRRNTGTILYRHSAQLFPVYDRAYFLRRMHRICGNAATVARELCARPDVRAVTRVVHPCSGEHPDHDIAQRLPYAGGCVTFAFHEVGGNHRDQLEALIDHLLDQARRAGLHLTKGVSFGFNTPRVSAAASMSESEPPFLRLYAGDRSSEQVRLLARVTGDAIAGFARSL